MRISVLTPTIRREGLQSVEESLERQTFRDFEWLQEINTTGEHDLNAAYNRMLRRAQGELIVSMQDYIKAPPDYLQKFWDAYQEHPRTFFTAPVGKVANLDYSGEIKWDWRAWTDGKANTVWMPGKWDCWEIDSGSAPKSALFEIGGFDEELDNWWSFDNVSVGKRAELAGYDFKNLFSNPVVVYDHDAFIPHPFRERFRPALVKLRMDEYNDNYKLPYLD